MVKNTKNKVLSVTIRVFTFSGGWLFGTIAGDNSSMKYKKVKGCKKGYKNERGMANIGSILG